MESDGADSQAAEAHFGLWVTQNRHGLVRQASRLAGADAAEDVVQESLLRVLGRLQSGQRIKNLPGYVRRAVRNNALRRRLTDAGEALPLALDHYARTSDEYMTPGELERAIAGCRITAV